MIPLVNCPGRFLRMASLSLSRVWQYLAALIVSQGCKVSNRRTPRLSQKTVPIILFADRMTLNFFATVVVLVVVLVEVVVVVVVVVVVMVVVVVVAVFFLTIKFWFH
ncbi:hypothetical protein ElyMa_005501400 [Elysia marginata]|uniref:Uncharacterized protein n=1 Tax=Elysia marginata TaxID=1093978 RepID=A0AAV4EUP3_9GAST|nr:hypothetical protein ElyMa_005501400 [Elysia marginata]